MQDSSLRTTRQFTPNLALALVPIGWTLAVLGAMSMMGDFAPDTPRHVTRTHEIFSFAFAGVGAACLAGALWLSGYTFSVARKRSILAACGVVLPFFQPLLFVIFH